MAAAEMLRQLGPPGLAATPSAPPPPRALPPPQGWGLSSRELAFVATHRGGDRGDRASHPAASFGLELGFVKGVGRPGGLVRTKCIK